MSRSTGWRARVVGGEGARRAVEQVLARDRGGQRQELGGQAAAQGVQLAGAVVFEAEHVFRGPEDALDTLAQRREVRSLAGLVFAAGTDDRGVQVGGVRAEVAAGVALVADDGQRAVAGDAGEHVQADLTFAGLWAGEREGAWRAVQREQAVQAKAPEVPAVAGAPAVVGGVGERAAARGLDRAA